MKKILLLLSVFALFSCEQEELDGLVESSKAKVEQKAAVENRAASSTIADFDPVGQLDGIPVNILNVGNTKNKYLSCVENGTKVDLYNKDDGSLRQRWYIKNGAIQLVGGNSKSSETDIYISSAFTSIGGSAYPLLLFKNVSIGVVDIPSYNWNSIGTSYYNITAGGGLFPSDINPLQYFQSESSTGTSLKFTVTNPGALAQWEIKPIGDFEIVDVTYVPYTGGKLDSIPQQVSIRIVNNSTSSIPLEKSFTDVIEVVETSRFSKTEGVSFTTSIATTRPLAGPGEPSKDNNGSVTITNSMTNSWTFTQETTQTKKSTRTDNFKVTVPPYTKYTVITYINQYAMNIKYVATLRATNGKEFKVKGIWSGTQCYEMYQDIKEENTGKTFRIYGEDANNIH